MPIINFELLNGASNWPVCAGRKLNLKFRCILQAETTPLNLTLSYTSANPDVFFLEGGKRLPALSHSGFVMTGSMNKFSDTIVLDAAGKEQTTIRIVATIPGSTSDTGFTTAVSLCEAVNLQLKGFKADITLPAMKESYPFRNYAYQPASVPAIRFFIRKAQLKK
ncbi:hypothetical protein [Chitinophaga nivalis]|uniref:Uncharacterized protein n=1 Tax=Chitinophaga nivalis TaxID=2991709 RepID=A0ABT3IJA3_9BACT|nr:hypothetical protein [Chitinophaga nivalis]MCW3466263.1 hypothetical protein [Chitinophaga nivalis]MCW3484046.1 hypothetical protein [Chitinophaga nivalis]